MNENQPLVFCSTIEIDSAQSTKNVQKAIEDIGKDAKVKVNGIDFNFDEVAKQFNKMVSQSFQISDNKIIGVTQAFKNQFGEIITLQHRVNEENQATLTSAKTTSNILEVQKSKYEEIRRLYEELGKLQVESVYANKKRTEELANETKNLKRNITLKEKELQSDERFLNVELQKSTIDKQKIANAKSLGQAEKEMYDTQQKRLKLENEIFKVKMQSENLGGNLSRQDLTVVEKQLELLKAEEKKLNGKLGYHGWNTKEYKEELEQITSINKLKEKAMTSDSKRVQLNNTLLATQKEINQLELQTQKNKGKDASLEATLNAQLLEKRALYAKTETEINKQGLQCEKTKTAILKENEKHQKSIAQEIAKQTTQQEKLNKSLEQNQKKLQQRIDNLKNTNTDFITSDNLVVLDKLEQKIKNLSATSTSHLAEQMRDLNLEFGKISSDVHSNKLKKTNSALGELGTTMKNVATYVSSAMVIDRLWDELAKGVEHIKDVDSAFTNMSMTMESLTKTQFNNMLSEVNAMSQQMGAVASETLQIAQTFANDKVTTEEVMAKLQPSVALMNISGMEATDVTKSIMSIANSYQMLADDGSNAAEVTEYLGDVLAKVSANMDMDFQDGLQGLVNGIGVAGSTMKAAGVDMEWFVAQLGNAMVATGQSADKLGRGMRTITARVMQQKQALEEMGESVEEVEIAMAKGEKTLNEIGVSIRDDLSGDLKSFSSIMDELGARWDGLTDSTKYYLAEQLAGKNQMDIFIGMMDSYKNSMELTEIAYQSQGTLMEMNGKYAESLQGKLNTLTSAQQQLYQTFINTDAYKSAIDGLTGVIQAITWLTDKVGALPTIMAPLSMAFLSFNNLGKMTSQTLMDLVAKKSKWVDNTIKVRNEKQLLIETTKLGIAKLKDDIVTQESLGKCTADLVGQLKTKNATLKQTQLELVGATIKTTALQVAMSALVSLGISAITWALSQAVGWLIQYADYAGRAQEATNQVNASAKDIENRLTGKNSESIQQMEELVSKYNDINTSEADKLKLAEEINTVKNTLIGLDEEYEGILNNQELSYEQQLNLLKAINQEKMRDSAEDLDKALDDKEGVSGTSAHHADQLEKVKKNILEIQELMSKMSDGQTVEFNGFTRSKEELAKILEDQKEKFQSHYLFLSDWNGKVQTLLDAGYDTEKVKYSLEEFEGLFDTVTEQIATKTEETGTILEQIEGKAKQYASTMNESLGGDFDVKSASQSLKSLVIKMEDLEDGSEDAEKALLILHNTFKDMPDNVDNVSDAIDYLNGKLKETDKSSNMKSLNETYLETMESMEEIQSLLDSLSDGLSVSEMRTLFDSDLLSDYNGALNDSVAIQEHLNDKMSEMQEAHNTAYMNMMAQDSEFWNNKMKNSQEWADFESGMMQNITQLGADMLGIQQQDFANFINEKGGFRQVDLSNAENMMDAEGMMNSGLINQMLGWYSQYVQEKGGARGVDMSNITEFLNKQGAVEIRTINQLIEAWTSYYNAKKAEIQSAIKTMTGNMGNALDKIKAEGGQVYDKYDMGNYDASINNEMASIQKQINQLNQANNAMNSFFSASKATWGGVSQSVGQSSYKPSTVGSGGSGSKGSGSKGSGGSNGSGSGSSSKDSEKEVEDLDLKIDRYYELNDAINTVNNALEMNRQLQKSATDVGTTKKLHEEEIKLLNEKLKAMQKLHLEQRNDMLDQKNILSSAGFNFDNEGNLTNYSSRLKELQNYANSLRGEAKAEQIEYTNSIMKTIEAYTTLANDTLPSTALSIEELTQEIKDVNKEHEKTLKLVEALGDRYYEINGLINDVDKKLAINQAKQNNATASDRVKLMKEEIALMKEKQDLLVQQGDELKTEAKELTKKLSEQGVEFNVDGTIKNYQQLMDKYKLIANQYVGEKRDEVIEEAEEMIELVEKYDDIIRNTLPDLAVEWEEYTSSIREAEKNMAQTVTDIQKDITSAIQNELEKRTEATKTELEKQKDLYNKQFDEEDWEDSLSAEQRKLDEIQQAINNMSRDTSLAGQLKLQQLREEYEAQQKVINDMIRDKEKENGNSRFDEEMEKLDKELEEVLDPQNIADLVNKSLVDGFVTIGDEVIALDTLMTDWLTETGDGLYAVGDLLREELIDNLRVAQQLMSGMGIVGMKSSIIDQHTRMRETDHRLQSALTLKGGGSQQKLEIAIGSLVEVQGNVTEEVLPKLESMIEMAKTELIDEIASEIMRR